MSPLKIFSAGLTAAAVYAHSQRKIAQPPELPLNEQNHWNRFTLAAENPHLLKNKQVKDLTVEELAVELEGFRGPKSQAISNLVNMFARFHKIEHNFSQLCRYIAVTTDCQDALQAGGVSASTRCNRIQSALLEKNI